MLLSQLTLLVLLLSSMEDLSINVQDLSFLVMTHGFDTTKDGIVILDDGSQYYLIPNGDEKGLARLEIVLNDDKAP